MSDLLLKLPRNARRGSKPRCHGLTHGTPDEVAARLSDLADPYVAITPGDRWMPRGFDDIREAQLHQAKNLLPDDVRHVLRHWWLAPTRGNPATPHWDVASICTIEGRPGMLLVEAKAHDRELQEDDRAKPPKPGASAGTWANYRQIANAIASANHGLHHSTGVLWKLDRDCCYELSNRFAWAWKLTELGYGVVLVYLGFLSAHDMADKGTPLWDQTHWEQVVTTYGDGVVPARVWGHRWESNGRPLIPLIRSLERPLIPEV